MDNFEWLWSRTWVDQFGEFYNLTIKSENDEWKIINLEGGQDAEDSSERIPGD